MGFVIVPPSREAKNGPDRPENLRRPQQFQPGREDAVGQANRCQDAFLKVGNEAIPQKKLDQLVAMVLGQEAQLAWWKQQGLKFDFVARSAPNGRPRR